MKRMFNREQEFSIEDVCLELYYEVKHILSSTFKLDLDDGGTGIPSGIGITNPPAINLRHFCTIELGN
jgi:hypothetical protein